jgi:hypothetical protein
MEFLPNQASFLCLIFVMALEALQGDAQHDLPGTRRPPHAFFG